MSEFAAIHSQTQQRYSQRYQQLGRHIRTLGWGNQEQQQYRFAQTLIGLNFDQRHILDIGCGFGDYYAFLKAEGIPIQGYTGIDINPDLLQEARQQWASETQVTFQEVHLPDSAYTPAQPCQIGVMLGVLNFNLQGQMDNYEYSQSLIRKAFSLVEEALVVDFLSTRLTPTYAQEDFVFYHDPVKMLQWALTLTPKVTLRHNYAPIPQREFMLVLEHEDL
jgi:SAM-dependent methyltransferase